MLPFFSFATQDSLSTYAQFLVGTERRHKGVRAFWLIFIACLFLRRIYERQPLLYAVLCQRAQEYAGTLTLSQLFGIHQVE
jgi:hypothetical protein